MQYFVVTCIGVTIQKHRGNESGIMKGERQMGSTDSRRTGHRLFSPGVVVWATWVGAGCAGQAGRAALTWRIFPDLPCVLLLYQGLRRLGPSVPYCTEGREMNGRPVALSLQRKDLSPSRLASLSSYSRYEGVLFSRVK